MKKVKSVISKTKSSVKKDSQYEDCRSATVNRYLKLYEKGTLIIRKKKISSRKQALAIGLSQAEATCASKMNSADIKKMEELLEKKSMEKPMNYSDIKRTLFLYQKYSEKKDWKKLASVQERLIHQFLYFLPQIPISAMRLIQKQFPEAAK